ncbi:MAG TPA: hypothetical protein VHG28_24650 [Longimicrobiaceae bacterium]|nr:hypothetical protein [Longimicrobiaceae bacterium]
MGRFLLVVLIAALALANPTVRSYLQPYLKFVFDPVYEWSARSRVQEIARIIEAERTAGRPLPTPRTFGGFLEERFPGGNGALDPWGVPYYLRRERGSLVVGSAGRDRKPGTEDDILAPVGPAAR